MAHSRKSVYIEVDVEDVEIVVVVVVLLLLLVSSTPESLFFCSSCSGVIKTSPDEADPDVTLSTVSHKSSCHVRSKAKNMNIEAKVRTPILTLVLEARHLCNQDSITSSSAHIRAGKQREGGCTIE